MINVYDFDKTIYNGDSTLDFYIFCIIKKPYLLIWLPYQILGLLGYLFKIHSKTRFKEMFYSFLNSLSDTDNLLIEFWSIHNKKISEWYLRQKLESDIIISASPEFLLIPICEQLKVDLIASKVNMYTGKYTGINCYGEEKAKRLEKEFGDIEVGKFYSDSISDMPLAKLALESYLVKGDVISDFKIY